MGNPDPPRREVDFARLNWVGKAIYLSGQAAKVAGTVIETVVDQAAAMITEAERAFQQGLKPEIEEAKILEEYEDQNRRRRHTKRPSDPAGPEA